ncbi:HAMP domain-containing protein [bacterium]|nr:HAMP domain-containing protein [bacterium]
MSTRGRIFLAAVVLIVLPAALLAVFLRARLVDTVTREFHARWRTELTATLERTAEASRTTREQLVHLAAAAADDNRLRLALSGERDDLLPYLREHAGRVARAAQLPVLELVDAEGRILSSAHYRHEFGGDDRPLLTALLARRQQAPPGRVLGSPELRAGPGVPEVGPLDSGTVFTLERTATRTGLAMLAGEGFTIGRRTYHWIGGRWTDPQHLATADTVLHAGLAALDPSAAGQADLDRWGDAHDQAWLALPTAFVHDGRIGPALLIDRAPRAGLRDQIRQIDALVGAVFAVVIAGAFLLAAWLSGRLSRPLAELAAQAERIDLGDPSADFATRRADEVGRLARVLDAMVGRLRAGARRLADAERRATLGEVARQVNHDLRNGITPVRNVVRHLGETAERDPGELAEVFQRRRPTLDSSLSYLEDLAGHYARLAPESRREACDLAGLARELATAHPGLVVHAGADVPRVLADPVSLRRILDNLLRNAREALPDGRGTIEVRVARADDPELGPQCVLVVADDGIGMPPEVRARVLEDFFTTKAGGSGLGLSNVRRLVGDAGGQLAIDSEPDRGTTVTITFPAAETEP